MQKSDVTCPKCNAGYRRIQLSHLKGTTGEYRCRVCDHVLEVFDGSTCVALRLTVQPEKASDAAQALDDGSRMAPRARSAAMIPRM
jgi:predicted Zn finger-like uncharacterized protein